VQRNFAAGRVKYFALSQVLGADSKHIPVTKEMTKRFSAQASAKSFLVQYDLPSSFFEAGILMIGGSTHLNKKGKLL